KRSPQPQPDPASESDQHLGCFAEAEIAAPAPHIRGQLFHCRLDANALGPSRDPPDSPLDPFQRFWRDRALDVRTSREAEPEELPFLRSCHRTLRLVYLELEPCVIKRVTHSITGCPAYSCIRRMSHSIASVEPASP